MLSLTKTMYDHANTLYSPRSLLKDMPAIHALPLANLMNEDNAWRKVMAIIPKSVDYYWSSYTGDLQWEEDIADGGFKYNINDIIQIECEYWRQNEPRFHWEIFFDKWTHSRCLHMSPTLGVLFQLLVKLELFKAADYMALLLKLEMPIRPEKEGVNIQKSPMLQNILSNVSKISTDLTWRDNKEPNSTWYRLYYGIIRNECQAPLRHRITQITSMASAVITWDYAEQPHNNL